MGLWKEQSYPFHCLGSSEALTTFAGYFQTTMQLHCPPSPEETFLCLSDQQPTALSYYSLSSIHLQAQKEVASSY
jgi:hypothetical protein